MFADNFLFFGKNLNCQGIASLYKIVLKKYNKISIYKMGSAYDSNA